MCCKPLSEDDLELLIAVTKAQGHRRCRPSSLRPSAFGGLRRFDARRLLNTLETLAVAAGLGWITGAQLPGVLGERASPPWATSSSVTISALHKACGLEPDAALLVVCACLTAADADPRATG
jgi:replication-associated recombination protein RarA